MAEIDVDKILYYVLQLVIRSFYEQESRAVAGVPHDSAVACRPKFRSIWSVHAVDFYRFILLLAADMAALTR